MGLTELLKANARHVAEQPLVFSTAQAQPTLIITGVCPSLTGALAPALGLTPGSAVVIQLAGAWGGREGEELLRSVVLAIYVHGCREIVVIGTDDAAASAPDRQQLRAAVRQAGLAEDSPQAEAINALARGPNSPRAGVQDTVRMLRNSALVPETIAVHGCLLRTDSGQLEVIDRDRRTGSLAPTPGRSRPTETGLADFPLPDLPDIPLPEIPSLDLDSLTAAPQPAPQSKRPAPARKADSYGQSGAGPISLADLQKMPEAQPGQDFDLDAHQVPGFDIPAFSTADVRFEVPKPAAIQDTGLGPVEAILPGRANQAARADVEARPDVQSRPDVAEPTQQPGKRPKPKPAPARKPEQPQVTPIVRQAKPQPPLGERVIEFVEPVPEPTRSTTPTRSATRVDIQAGYVAKDGAEFPLDPELQRALLKVTRFLASEFAMADRGQIMGRIRRASQQGQPTGELLKLMIGPVLKLGKKRYAVINELLKIKEELPRQAPDVALALLEEILTGN
jgi:carbonic anhydrase